MQLFEPAPFTLITPSLGRLHAYWDERRGERKMPMRRDIDPLDLGFILGSLLLIDVLRDPLQFHIRVHGTEIVRHSGYELTGKKLSDLPVPEFHSHALAHFRAVLDTKRPHRSLTDRYFDERSRRYEAVLLPLSDNDEDVERLLIGMVYFK